jgi:hypothetical protein
MIVDRRTFILVSAPFVAAASVAASSPLLLFGAAPSQLSAVTDDVEGVVFKIAGWDRCAEVAGDCLRTSSAGLIASNTMGDDVFISINQSWRTAWR